jgi:hypothetical protein
LQFEKTNDINQIAKYFNEIHKILTGEDIDGKILMSEYLSDELYADKYEGEQKEFFKTNRLVSEKAEKDNDNLINCI